MASKGEQAKEQAGGQAGEQTVLHYPRLDTVLMVEDAINAAKDYPTRMGLWKMLPRQVQYQTFKVILEYLEKSNKILFTKGNRIMWIFADSPKARKLIEKSSGQAQSLPALGQGNAPPECKEVMRGDYCPNDNSCEVNRNE